MDSLTVVLLFRRLRVNGYRRGRRPLNSVSKFGPNEKRLLAGGRARLKREEDNKIVAGPNFLSSVQTEANFTIFVIL